MRYQEYTPGEALKPFVKCYYLSEHDKNPALTDRAFATGCIEVMFNVGEGRWQTGRGTDFVTTPSVELWGQIIEPLTFKSVGKNTMFGIRFYTHTASLFLEDSIALFNNKVSDFVSIAGIAAHVLHQQLIETTSPQSRISLIEAFLLKRLSRREKRIHNFRLVDSVIAELKSDDFFDNIQNVANHYGISSRYLQKLFLQYTGLTPKLYHKINRFQKGLVLMGKHESLTSVAYDCGYFDQSHFIRDFRFFTDLTPSIFEPENSSAILASK
jgi:AraC-like DNA-binding protein